jgi:8-hydroxy-5-deazaflavin:NADPH oxidoreductase
MRIAIIGAGNVGKAVGANWVRAGHEIRYGVRNPADAKYAGLAVASVAEAARAGEAVLIATPWPATEAAIAAAGDLAGKLVLDSTNPLAMGPDGLMLALGHTNSGGEMVAGWAKGAAVFKTLNQTGFANMGDAGRYAPKPVMFYAGDDAARRGDAARLVGDLGFEAVDAGPMRNARLLEAYAMLWIDLAMKRGQGRNFAFALTRR